MSLSLEQIFSTHTGKAEVVVVDPSSQARTTMLSALRARGFSKVTPLSSLADAKRYIRANKVSWLITTLNQREGANGFSVLKSIKNDETNGLKFISFFVDSAESECLESAFEMGLFTWHSKPYTKESVLNEVEELFQECNKSKFNPTMVSASYLRRYLVAEKKYDELVNLEESLLTFFEGYPELLLPLSEAKFRQDKFQEAISLLTQARALDAGLADRVNIIYKRVSEKMQEKSHIGLGIQSVVIIDHDQSVLNIVGELFEKFRVPQVKLFDNGPEAYSWIRSNSRPDLIVMEWKLRDLNGPAFIQRLKSDDITSPVVLVSSLVKPQDMPLLNEMGVAHLINKPINQKEFIMGISWALRQCVHPTEDKTLEQKILHCLEVGKFDEAKRFKTVYFASKDISPGRRKYIEALFLYHTDQFLLARDFVIQSIKLSGQDSLLTMNLLGKCLMKLEDYEGALRCFEKAQTLNPANIERICNISDIHVRKGELDEAKEKFEQAHEIDADSELVNRADAKINLANGEIQKARTIMSKLKSIAEIISTMNNRAVTLIKAGRERDGIKEYIKTLQAIPDNKQNFRFLVNYNLGLAYVKINQLKSSVNPLKQATGEGSPVNAKASSLLDRVVKSIKNGTKVMLNSSKKAEEDDEFDFEEESLIQAKNSALEFDFTTSFTKVHSSGSIDVAKAGGLCLSGIYESKDGKSELAETLLSA